MAFKKVIHTADQDRARVGDAPELAYLTKEQWNILVGNALQNKRALLN